MAENMTFTPKSELLTLEIKLAELQKLVDSGMLTGRSLDHQFREIAFIERELAMMGNGHAKFKNDRGVPEIRIGAKEFKYAGASDPQDHPHIYLNMGSAETILCPYCATSFCYDPRLEPHEADPPDSFFVDD